MAHILYFLMWRTFCISWCGVQYSVSPDVAYILFLAFPDMAYICISWCGVFFVFPDVAYNISYLLMWRIYCSRHFLVLCTSCISWRGALFVFLDVAYNILYLLMWRIYCSSDIHNISWYGVHPVFPYVTYFLYFLMWRTINSISWYGVHPVFPDVT